MERFAKAKFGAAGLRPDWGWGNEGIHGLCISETNFLRALEGSGAYRNN